MKNRVWRSGAWALSILWCTGDTLYGTVPLAAVCLQQVMAMTNRLAQQYPQRLARLEQEIKKISLDAIPATLLQEAEELYMIEKERKIVPKRAYDIYSFFKKIDGINKIMGRSKATTQTETNLDALEDQRAQLMRDVPLIDNELVAPIQRYAQKVHDYIAQTDFYIDDALYFLRHEDRQAHYAQRYDELEAAIIAKSATDPRLQELREARKIIQPILDTPNKESLYKPKIRTAFKEHNVTEDDLSDYGRIGKYMPSREIGFLGVFWKDSRF